MTQVLLIFSLLIVLFTRPPVLNVLALDGQSVLIQATVPTTPEFSYQVSRHSTVEIDNSLVTVSLKGNSDTLMIGHTVKMVINSLSETNAITNNNSQAFFNLSPNGLVTGDHRITVIDTFYSPPIFIKKDMIFKILPAKFSISTLYNYFQKLLGLSSNF